MPFVDAATLKPQRITLADGKTIDLKLPNGVEEGTKIRLAGKGEQGPDGPGDGLVTISIAPHPFYRRDGNDIRMDLPVTLKEAVTGREGEGADAGRAGDDDDPQGQQLGEGAADQGPRLHRQERQAWRPAR